jgi:hypothetical protein
MPSITPVDAQIKAADNLVDTISGLMPKNGLTADAVEQLMEIKDTGQESGHDFNARWHCLFNKVCDFLLVASPG